MDNASNLWRNYHQAIAANNPVRAQQILALLHNYKSNPVPPKGRGCSSCSRRFR